jgi:N-acetylglucosamine malate deacetylase 2
MLRRFLIPVIVWLSLVQIAFAQNGPHALVVVAHPDDESILSVTLYKLVKEQHGTADIFVITNGEAGYHYSTLAEGYYGCKLTNASDARKKLPAIRKKELHEAGSVLGISNYYFGNQPDSHYSLDEHEPLDTSWNVPLVQKQLHELLTHHHYDYIFCLLPDPGTHAGHKAATLLALKAVAALPKDQRPVILGAALRDKNDTAFRFSKLGDYALTQTQSPAPSFVTDRTVSFGYNNKINYKIIADWELAAHKSQGATQMTMNDGDLELFWYFSLNGNNRLNQTVQLFNKLQQSPYDNRKQLYGQIAQRPQ